MNRLYLRIAPPLDPAWTAYQIPPGRILSPSLSIHDKQARYALVCRLLTDAHTMPGSRDYELQWNVKRMSLTVPSRIDEFPIPVLKYTWTLTAREVSKACSAADEQRDDIPMTTTTTPPPVRILYIHGGGLHIGEADSEELSILRINSALPVGSEIFSVTYRLMPDVPAQTCLDDCLSNSTQTQANATRRPKLVLVGSSSGGELAALISQAAEPGTIDGVLLRGPVTSDAPSGEEYVPERLRWLHTSAREPSFRTNLLGLIRREVPRDGLERMPLEAELETLSKLPPTWIQVCTNDTLYSDGVCYAKALDDAGVPVRVDVIKGWPHTFWLVAPELDKSLEAEEAMLKGLEWILETAK
ncbi:Alpha/Beta hydrolase protein [Echria macrotheca]|uniref:Alpha/Beta hydrolase protein n=1 Tax=Echria macrotheca TaxID=438768 RepID=A0AAJ0F0K6_9PEZI|nr:Alpha/Beta hydrolase protein [Echria macrotheca]